MKANRLLPWVGRMTAGLGLGLIGWASVGAVGGEERRPLLRRLAPSSVATSQASGLATCGNGVLEEPDEECEPGVDAMGEPLDEYCPDRCIAPGEAGECACHRPCVLEDCEFCPVLTAGTNGPFLTHGGLFSFVPDSPVTLIDTCGSDYDTQLIAEVATDCNGLVYYNEECAPGDSYNNVLQDPGSPFAECYDPVCTPDPSQGCDAPSCLCVPTTVGETYRLLVAESEPTFQTFVPPLGSNTVINITRMISCEEGPIPDSCCDRTTGVCTDDVAEADCTGEYQVFQPNLSCELAEPCEPVSGACCDPAFGDDGCTETLLADCDCPGCHWTAGATCAEVACGAPAASAWGLLALGMLTLVGGTIVLGRGGAPAG